MSYVPSFLFEVSLTKKELARLSLIERISSSISAEDSNLI